MPQIAQLGDGYIVAWLSNHEVTSGSGRAVYMQRYDGAGSPIEAETQVNAITNGNELRAVLPLADGVMVIWSEPTSGSTEVLLRGQKILDDGSFSGGEIQIAVTDYQMRDTFEALAGGGFVHVTRHQTSGQPGIEIYSRIHDASGAPVGAEFMINPVAHDPHGAMSVASLSDGGFLVGYNSSAPGGAIGFSPGSEIRRFDSNGTEVGVVVPHAWPDNLRSITEMANDRFVAVWQSTELNPVFTAKVFTLAGTVVGQTFQIPSSVPPVITGLTDGGFVAVWHHNTGSGAGSILSAHYDGSGALVGEVTTLAPPVNLTFPTVAATAACSPTSYRPATFIT